MARRIALTAALCAVAAGIPATPALAHAGNPNYESLVNGVTPAIPGFTVDVLNGDDRLEVQNAGRTTITIGGYDKEPYVRMSPGGKVEVNVRSPAYYLNQDRTDDTRVPASADSRAAPQWRVVSRNGRYEFHDHRIHWMARSIPQQVKDKAKRTRVVDWHVPVRTAAGASGAINGSLFWRGSGPGAPTGAFLALGAIVLLGGGAVILVRRRRAADGAGPTAGGSGGAASAPPRAGQGQAKEAW
jgi:LPXTG-motif cell wall-anchored protein